MKNHEFALAKSVTGNISLTSSPEKRSVLSNLESLLKTQIDKRQTAQKQLLEYRHRGLIIQRQFRRILQKSDGNVANLNGTTYTQDSQLIYMNLMGQIQNFNNVSKRMLQKRCNQILFMMNRRISQILEKTDVEVQRNKKLSQEEYKLVKVQIKEALNLAKEIQFQNQELKKINKELNFKFNVVREERNLLIEELSQKKTLLIKMMKADVSRENSSCLPTATKTSQVGQFTTRKIIITDDNNSITKEPYLLPSSSNFIEEQSAYRTITKGRINSMSKGRQGDSVVRTESHFRMCLDRERRKNSELKAMVCRLQVKYKQLSLLLERSGKELKRESKSEDRCKNMEKLIQAIKLKLIPFSSQQQSGLSEDELQSLISV